MRRVLTIVIEPRDDAYCGLCKYRRRLNERGLSHFICDVFSTSLGGVYDGAHERLSAYLDAEAIASNR